MLVSVLAKAPWSSCGFLNIREHSGRFMRFPEFSFAGQLYIQSSRTGAEFSITEVPILVRNAFGPVLFGAHLISKEWQVVE